MHINCIPIQFILWKWEFQAPIKPVDMWPPEQWQQCVHSGCHPHLLHTVQGSYSLEPRLVMRAITRVEMVYGRIILISRQLHRAHDLSPAPGDRLQSSPLIINHARQANCSRNLHQDFPILSPLHMLWWIWSRDCGCHAAARTLSCGLQC